MQDELQAHEREIQKVRDEMTRTHRLYIDEQITAQGFGEFYKPAEVRLNQLVSELIGCLLESADCPWNRHSDLGGPDPSAVQGAHGLDRPGGSGTPHHRDDSYFCDKCQNFFGRHSLYAITRQPTRRCSSTHVKEG